MEGVGAGVAAHEILVCAAREDVAAAPALDDVVPATAANLVVALAADKDIGELGRFAKVGHRRLLWTNLNV